MNLIIDFFLSKLTDFTRAAGFIILLLLCVININIHKVMLNSASYLIFGHNFNISSIMLEGNRQIG